MQLNPAALKAIRERTGLTRGALASAAAIEESVYSRLEAGKRRGNARQIKRLAVALQVPMVAISVPDPEDLIPEPVG